MEKIREIIKSMTLDDKVRQLTQINAEFVKADMGVAITGVAADLGLSSDDIFGSGSVLNFGGADDALHIRSQYLENSKLKIPLVLMQDVIHGYRTIFPIPLAIACTFDESVAFECARISGIEAAANGVDVTFSPMINLSRDARWGRVMESYGEDVLLNCLFGRATIRGYREGGVASCLKHFVAYGADEGGRDYNTTDVSEHSLREYYLRPFKECLKENLEVIMTSFNMLGGLPVNADGRLLNGILREEWGYDGVVVSDYGAVVEMINHGFAENEKECARVAANNNIDLEMMSSAYIKHLPSLVKEGKVSEETIDKMVERVLVLKNKLGLFENPYNGTSAEKANALCLSKEHRDAARRAAVKSFVLLENDGVLPLAAKTNIALVGPLAAEKNILGAWACAGRREECVSVEEGISALLDRKITSVAGCSYDLLSTDTSGISAAVKATEKCDVAVCCIGEYSYASGECASRTDIRVPFVQVELLKAIKATGKKVVAVVFGGRPQVLTEVKKYSDAVLYVWQPGSEGGNAIADVLFGVSAPVGKLAMSFPRAVGQCPVYYNHFNTGRPKLCDELYGHKYSSSYIDELNSPLYPFGYGKSYTEFEYSKGTISANKMKCGETLSVRASVKNCGGRDGEEVVQLYVRDKFASYVRPVRELKAFKKVFIKAGQTADVEFAIDEEMLKFYGASGKFAAEAGAFDVMIGGDGNCPVCGTFELTR